MAVLQVGSGSDNREKISIVISISNGFDYHQGQKVDDLFKLYRWASSAAE